MLVIRNVFQGLLKRALHFFGSNIIYLTSPQISKGYSTINLTINYNRTLTDWIDVFTPNYSLNHLPEIVY